jgi:DNA-binding transcriptional MerR regulator
MRIGEVARRTGLTVHTLRFYERKGLLPRAARGTSNYRDFPAKSIERLTFIREAQRLGFTLSEVREFVDTRNTPMGCAELRSKGQRKLLEIEAELGRLRTIRASLRKLLRECDVSIAAAPCAVSITVGDIRRT